MNPQPASMPDPIVPPCRAAVLGAGPIGCATAAVLVQQGYEVAIYDIDEPSIQAITEAGGVEVRGVLVGHFPLRLASTDIAPVLEGTRLVVSCVPASAHEAVARVAAPWFEEGTLLLVQPGQTLSALTWLQVARSNGLRSTLIPVETLGSLYTCRLAGPGRVNLYAIKRTVLYAALPSSYTPWAGAILEPVFPALSAASSVLYISMHNLNAVVHPSVTLFNVGMIDRAQPFLYYIEGATPHVLRVTEALDAERLAIAHAYGIEQPVGVLRWYREAYGIPKDDLYGLIQEMVAYKDIKGPTTLQTRLLLEDIPTGIVPYWDLGRRAGVPTPNTSAILELCNTLYATDFRAAGRTLDHLGYPDIDVAGIRALLG